MEQSKLCGTCQHWKRQPNISPVVGQPAIGQCRESPPQIVVIQQAGQLQFLTQYPSVHELVEACSRYSPVLTCVS